MCSVASGVSHPYQIKSRRLESVTLLVFFFFFGILGLQQGETLCECLTEKLNETCKQSCEKKFMMSTKNLCFYGKKSLNVII